MSCRRWRRAARGGARRRCRRSLMACPSCPTRRASAWAASPTLGPWRGAACLRVRARAEHPLPAAACCASGHAQRQSAPFPAGLPAPSLLPSLHCTAVPSHAALLPSHRLPHQPPPLFTRFSICRPSTDRRYRDREPAPGMAVFNFEKTEEARPLCVPPAACCRCSRRRRCSSRARRRRRRGASWRQRRRGRLISMRPSWPLLRPTCSVGKCGEWSFVPVRPSAGHGVPDGGQAGGEEADGGPAPPPAGPRLGRAPRRRARGRAGRPRRARRVGPTGRPRRVGPAGPRRRGLGGPGRARRARRLARICRTRAARQWHGQWRQRPVYPAGQCQS